MSVALEIVRMDQLQEFTGGDMARARFMQGWQVAHLRMDEDPSFKPFAGYEVAIAGLINCGIGGFECNSCNGDVFVKDPTVLDYINGVSQAIADRNNGVKL